MALDIRKRLLDGLVIPAHPLALTADRRLDPRRQTALTRYYLDAGAGGIAVGVHTTQFGIHDPLVGLYPPVLQLAATTAAEHGDDRVLLVAGVTGRTPEAVGEAITARELGYHAVLVSLAGLDDVSVEGLVDHMRAVAEVLPVIAFYLQPAVGGRPLPIEFWHAVAAVEQLVAVKIAPFDRYRTSQVIRAIVEAGRADDVALYTGNDDHIVLDLLTPYRFGNRPPVHMVGGLLGQWAIWANRAVEIHAECRRIVRKGEPVPISLFQLAQQITDANSAIFDSAHGYAGALPGIHEVLRRQGLLEGTWCLDEREVLSPGQKEEIDRVLEDYPELTDDEFVRENIGRWMG